ncbi:MAG: CarD family transcriptional regulator [Candidatus Saccharibacteria bacterium]|nr:CarD family transcriptional regulator [Candidatus Saccharibacteria bacterium]
MLATKTQTAALVNLFHQGTRLTYKKGEFIIRPGETPPGIFYIEKGLVKAYDITKYGEENLLIVRKEREIFPLIWAITGQDRRVIYESLAPTEVWRLDRKIYINYIEKNSEVLAPLLDMTIEMYRLHSERIINLEYRTVRERLISFLLSTSDRFGKEVAGGIEIQVPLKQQDIASSINASRETTSRELNLLHRKGYVDSGRALIIIKDAKTLKSFL